MLTNDDGRNASYTLTRRKQVETGVSSGTVTE